MEKCSGIYRIDCSGECLYVGQSINLDSRKKSHLRKLRNNKHYNIYLQRLYNKYATNFIFSEVERCDVNILTEREMYWINKLKPKCNMQIPCDSTYFTITDESRKRMSEATKSRMNDEMRKIISQKTKEAMSRPDVRNNFLEGQKSKTKKDPWNKGLKGISKAPNRKQVYCEELKNFLIVPMRQEFI